MKSAGEIREDLRQAKVDRKIIENRLAVSRGEKTWEEVIKEAEKEE